MGTCLQPSFAEDQTNDIITDYLRCENIEEAPNWHILLIGAKNSGKSTVFKQYKVIFGDGFDSYDTAKCKQYIHYQCIEQMKLALKHLNKYNNENEHKQYILSTEGMKAKQYFDTINNWNDLNANIVTSIKCLWNDIAFQQIYNFNHTYEMAHSGAYFWSNIDRISSDEYIPTNKDILMLDNRHKTRIEKCYHCNKYCFTLINPNTKYESMHRWIDMFRDVEIIVFVASLSCYDTKVINYTQLLVCGYMAMLNINLPNHLITLVGIYCDYDREENEMTKQLDLFQYICNHCCFKRVTKTIIFTKMDIFEEKIKVKPINVCPIFAHYAGEPDSMEDSFKCISNAFRLKSGKSPLIHVHFGNAIDTDWMETVFKTEMIQIIRALKGRVVRNLI